MSGCEALIQYDDVVITENQTNNFYALNFVTRDNYEAAKSSLATKVPEYFDGNFDQFSEKRNQMASLMAEAGSSTLNQGYYSHILSSAALEKYSDCLAKSTNNQISAWVVSKTDQEIAISIRTGLGGLVAVHVEIVGSAVPTDGEYKFTLLGSGVKTIYFKFDRKKDFSVSFNSRALPTGAQDATTVEVLKELHYERRYEQKELRGEMDAHAGGKGNVYNDQVIHDGVIVADPGFYLKPETLKVVSVQAIGPGLASRDEKNVFYKNERGQVVKVVLSANGAVGNNADTQGGGLFTYSVQSERPYLVEV